MLWTDCGLTGSCLPQFGSPRCLGPGRQTLAISAVQTPLFASHPAPCAKRPQDLPAAPYLWHFYAAPLQCPVTTQPHHPPCPQGSFSLSSPGGTSLYQLTPPLGFGPSCLSAWTAVPPAPFSSPQSFIQRPSSLQALLWDLIPSSLSSVISTVPFPFNISLIYPSLFTACKL